MLCLVLASTARAQDKIPVWDQFGFKDDSTQKGKLFNLVPGSLSNPPYRWHGFELSTQLGAETRYNDNLYATENNQKTDGVARFSPAVRVAKNLGRHAAFLSAEALITRHWEHTNEDIEDYKAEAGLMLEAYHSFKIPLKIGYSLNHAERDKQRGATYTGLTRTPIEYNTLEAVTGFEYQPSRLGVEVLGRYGRTRLEDNRLNAGAASIQRGSDVDTAGIEAKLSYKMKANFKPFVFAKWAKEDFVRNAYVQGAGFTGDNKDNDVTIVRAGAEFDYKGLLLGSFAAGWEHRSYEQGSNSDAQGLSMAANLNWVISPKYTLDVRSHFSTAEDIILKAGLEKRGGALGLNYELQRDWFARITAAYEEEEFIRTGRTDTTSELGAELQYMLSPRMSVSAGMLARSRDSDSVNADLDNQIFMLRATGSL